MILSGERIGTGDYLNRLYVQVDEDVPADELATKGTETLKSAKERAQDKMRAHRARTSLQGIMPQAEKVFTPYTTKLKQGCHIDWWAAYQIGQHIKYTVFVDDSKGIPHVFIVGDACHTFSLPKSRSRHDRFHDGLEQLSLETGLLSQRSKCHSRKVD
jgi:phenol 2-monooxygenase